MLIKLIGLYRSQYWTSAFNTDGLQKLIKRDFFFKKAGKCHPQVNCYLGRVLLFDGDYRDALRASSRDSQNDVYQM